MLMKTKTPAAWKTLAPTLAALLGGSLLALAQPAPGEKPANRPALPRAGEFQQRLQAIVGRGDFAALRVLTEEQRESFRQGMETHRDKLREFEGQLRDARKEMMAVGLADKFDEDAVRKKALEVGRIEAELTVLRAKVLANVKPALSTEQIEQIKNPPPFNPGEFRGANRGDIPARPNRPAAGPRDEHDLPSKPKPEN